ncbi:MAG: type II secretion system major pseudopilin GspG [Phycisphaerae bacterium]|nr:type II secretion system major pseudopilin GspG [Phycisphaerae bacterium]
MNNRGRHPTAPRAFTLIEVLFVVIILGLIATLVVGRLGQTFSKGKIQTTVAQLRSLGNAVEDFRADVGRIPTEQEGLKALVERPQGVEESKWSKGGYLGKRTVPNDAWGNPYIYKIDPAFEYIIKSLGADGKEGGEGDNADLDNRK